jgi:hypothetical protein
MTSERWQVIKRVLELVGEASPEERLGVLTAACAGDEDVRREAESLLSFEDKAALLDAAVLAIQSACAGWIDNQPQMHAGARKLKLSGPRRLSASLSVSIG